MDGDSEDALLLATQTPKILCYSFRVGFAPEKYCDRCRTKWVEIIFLSHSFRVH